MLGLNDVGWCEVGIPDVGRRVGNYEGRVDVGELEGDDVGLLDGSLQCKVSWYLGCCGTVKSLKTLPMLWPRNIQASRLIWMAF